MTQEKRNIQIILDKLWVEYSQLYQKVNNLQYYLLSQSNNLLVDIENNSNLKLLHNQYEVMEKYLNILKERIDILSKQFKECK